MTIKPSIEINGERWFKFFANYQYDGKTFSFNFYARNQTEAEAMLRGIRTTAVECHQIQGEIPASTPGAGWFVRAFCGLRNLLSRS